MNTENMIEYKISAHAETRYAERIMGKDTKYDINRFIADNKEKIKLTGELPSPENLPQGCKFHTRCPHVMDKCKCENPNTKEFTPTHNCKCFLYE